MSDDDDGLPPNSRSGDYDTSSDAGGRVHRKTLAAQTLPYFLGHPEGLNQSEFGKVSGWEGTVSCYWHRLGDARALGWLAWLRDKDGRIVKRLGYNGRYQNVSILTPAGMAKLGLKVEPGGLF